MFRRLSSSSLFPSTTLFRSAPHPLRPVARRGAHRQHLPPAGGRPAPTRSEEHTSELQSPDQLVCRLLLEKKKVHGLTQLRLDIGVENARRFQHVDRVMVHET